MGAITVRILNWDAYNEKRKDVKNPTWLRLENGFPQSQSLFGLPALPRYVFVTLLCYANEKQSAELKFDVEWFVHHYGNGAFTADELAEGLVALEGRTINVDGTWANERVRARTCAGVTRRDVTVRDDTYADPPENAAPPGDAGAPPKEPKGKLALVLPAPWLRNELEAIYRLYPRKEGKKAGMRVLEKAIRDPEKLSRLRAAVENYVALCQREKRETRHMKHWSSFANNWEDYWTDDLGLERSRNVAEHWETNEAGERIRLRDGSGRVLWELAEEGGSRA